MSCNLNLNLDGVQDQEEELELKAGNTCKIWRRHNKYAHKILVRVQKDEIKCIRM